MAFEVGKAVGLWNDADRPVKKCKLFPGAGHRLGSLVDDCSPSEVPSEPSEVPSEPSEVPSEPSEVPPRVKPGKKQG